MSLPNGRFPEFSRGRLKEMAIKTVWFLCAIFAIITIFFILAFLIGNAYPVFQEIGIWNFLTGTSWTPSNVDPQYGIFPLIVGTLLVTFGAMVIAVPLSIASAIYIAEIASPRVKSAVKPAVELLAGIPSVVFGFFGLIILTNWLRIIFNIPTGESWLAGSIILAIMALPTIISVSEDAISSVPREYREGSLALGATGWQTISRVTAPAALSGITAAIILGMGRAIGETMAVLMVTGNAAIIPDPIWNVLSPVRTLTGTIGIEMGEVSTTSLHYNALFGIAVVLLVIALIVNILATVILARIRDTTHASACSGDKPEGSIRKSLSSLRDILVPNVPYILIACAALAALVIAGPLATVVVIALLLGIKVLHERISPRWAQRAAYFLIGVAMVVVLFSLAVILYDIIANGLPYLTWSFLTEAPTNLGRSGGIFPAIVGTLYLVAGAIAIALPIGIGAAIYLTEYTMEGRTTKIIRAGADLLNGTPSIVFGLFGFAFLVLFLNFGVSLIAGQVTLALMILPTIIRTTEESLKTVPHALREGSFALGATKWQTISRVVLPPALPGIITGTILSIGRAAGETAPIMFTAVVFSSRFLPQSLFDPVMALPYHLFILATNIPGASGAKYGTALVLLLIVIAIYAVAIAIRSHYHRKLRW
ncbi:MAG: phosphate ABC transporter permease PstA [Methanoregulaceae archaeon]